ncbi:MAG: lamin tail domain-containing protein [Permianibacter sp.]
MNRNVNTPHTARRQMLTIAIGLSLTGFSATAAADVVISQLYGGGGNSGATLRHDFVELHNTGSAPVTLDGWSLQYASASGSSWQRTHLSGVIAAGQYLLIQQAAGSGGSVDLPTPDVIGSIAMSNSSGKLALVNHQVALTCSTGCDSAAGVIDFVGFGSASSSETAPVSALNNSSAALRKTDGCTDTDNNSSDFVTGTPSPRNSASSFVLCSGDGGGEGGGGTGGNDKRIRDIQGHAHLSPLAGQQVSNVPGVVTAVRNNGFFLQDETPDADPATSEAILVYTGSAPTVAVGDRVTVSGTVTEFRPGGSGGGNNLTITELTSPTVTTLASGIALPAPVVLGSSGRAVPSVVIASGVSGSIETRASLQLGDGIDFYESLEGMRVQINGALVVGPTSNFNEIPVVADNGLNADLRTARNGVVIRANDFNPERIILDDGFITLPAANVGDSFANVVGVMDYSFGNFKLLPTTISPLQPGGLQPEQARVAMPGETTIASYNVENLAASNDAGKFTRLAQQIVNQLRNPDIIALMEVQDDNGASNDSVVSADQTVAKLVAAIQAAGGPLYHYRDIDPADDQDGGQPGGNIRQGFLFNPLAVRFVDRAGASATTANAVVSDSSGARLQYSPGRIAPTDSAFADSRKPLAGEFLIDGNRVFVIANHFNSKGGDQPLFGRYQPPARNSELQRTAQANVVAEFVADIRDADPNAKIVVLGDINDFQFSDTMAILEAAGLHDLINTLPENERYTYVFEGNSQALDHILVSDGLRNAVSEYDVVHINSEFADQASDHDPEVAYLQLPLGGSDVSDRFSVYKSGLSHNRVSGLYSASVTLTATAAVSGPLIVRLAGLPSDISLINADGLVADQPFLRLAPVQPGQKISLSLQFRNPARKPFSYSVTVRQGEF